MHGGASSQNWILGAHTTWFVSVFQSCIDKIFRDLHRQGVVVYIDNILIYSATRAEHVSLVRRVLGRLLEHNLYVKAEKCLFFQQAVSFLGYLISTSEVEMESNHISAMRNWPTPTTVKEVQVIFRVCQLLPGIYQGFWSGCCSHYLTAEGGSCTSAVVS
jgi:hypothetical protein